MEIQRPIYWHQGLFLQPQHLQLQDLSFDSHLTPYQDWMTPYFWGVVDLEIKKASLGLKSFGVVKGSFVFPDGSFVQLPGNAIIEDRSFDGASVDGGRPFKVFLGLRKWNAGADNVTIQKKGASLTSVSSRFVTTTDPEKVKDLHTGGAVGHVKFLNFALKLFWESEKEQAGEYVLIPIAQVERNGAEFILSKDFIPPLLTIGSFGPMAKLVKEISDQLLSRSRELEEYKSQRGIQRAEFGSKDMTYLLALRSINRFLPSLQHWLEAPHAHPWGVYGILRQIIGDLSCFSETFNVMGENADRSVPGLPQYNHESLYSCFSSAQKIISKLLQEITAGPDHVFQMFAVDGIYSADIKPSILDGDHRFYLAIKTNQDPKAAVRSIDQLAKVSSREHLGVLISHALPGLQLEHVSVPPQELPRRSNVLYFSIDSHGEQWAHVKKENNISLAWDEAPEGLQVELMVVAK